MSLNQANISVHDTLNQLAGFTGFGWTASVLLFLATTIHSGSNPVGRLVTDPQVLLYYGAVLFATTFVLDRFTAPSD